MADPVLLDEIFTVRTADKGRFERVMRFEAVSALEDILLTLDVHSELFSVAPEQSVSVQITASLENERLKDAAEYVMQGKVYRVDEGAQDRLTVYASFGGLLLCLDGSARKLLRLSHENIFILLRR